MDRQPAGADALEEGVGNGGDDDPRVVALAAFASLQYLREVEARLEGIPVKEIRREADAFGADLVVMTTPHRSWLIRSVRRSTAERVFRKADVPVMLFGAR